MRCDEKIQSGTPVEDVDIVIDKSKDTMDYSREINDILSQPIDYIIIDDDDLLKELVAYTYH